MDGATLDIFLIWLGATLQSGALVATGDRILLTDPVSRTWLGFSILCGLAAAIAGLC